jgi:DNA-binding CsgD family transcriptional regulator
MLESVGVSAAAEAVYLAMLHNPLWGVTELAEHLQSSECAIREALDELAERALVSPVSGADHRLRAVSPQTGLSPLLAQAEAELVARQRQIEATRATIAAIAAQHDDGRSRDEVIRLEGLDAVRDRLVELAEATALECLTFTAGPALSEDTIAAARPLNERALGRGVQMRNIYQESARNDPATVAFARWMASLGARSRTVPAVAMRMTIIDQSMALIPIHPDEPRRGALEIRSRGIVAALCLLFEEVWTHATPFGEAPKVNDGGLSPQEQTLLHLLDAGYTDESAGRKLGVSARTVRRIVAELTARLRITSRFQAGAEAVRRGWL